MGGNALLQPYLAQSQIPTYTRYLLGTLLRLCHPPLLRYDVILP